jgi:hypothetical protein
MRMFECQFAFRPSRRLPDREGRHHHLLDDKLLGIERIKYDGNAPTRVTSGFTAAALNNGGITKGRYGSNNVPRAWQTLAQVEIR